MDILLKILESIPLLIVELIIEYRLPGKTLQRKYAKTLTVFIMAAMKLLAVWLNLSLHLAIDIGGNTLYYGFITLASYVVLFKGRFVKKIFFTVLIACGIPLLFYIFLPFTHYFFLQETKQFLLALKILDYVHILLSMLCMEYIGKKFQNLRRDFPSDYTIYLTAVIIFVYIAVYSAYDRIFMMNQGSLPLFSTLTLAIFAIIGTIIVVIAIFAVDRQVNISLKEQLHIMQVENFKSREVEWRKFSGFRHDIKNHLICLDSLLRNAKTEQAVLYMQNLAATVQQFDNPVQTGNDYADALLSVKYSVAAAKDIEVSLDMCLPTEGFIEPIDLCCILSNAFDNAIAACNRLEDGKKWIKARSFIKQDQLVIEIKNSCPSGINIVDGEVFPKEITTDHGLGLDNVRAVVSKYGGVLDLAAGDAFSFGVLLPKLHL